MVAKHLLNALALFGVATLLISGVMTATPAAEVAPAVREAPADDPAVEKPVDTLPAKAPIQCIRAPCELAPEDPNYVPADDQGTVGICVIGFDSPCNGEDYGAADEPKADAPKGGGEIYCIRAPCELAPEDPNYVPADEEPRMGICAVGFDSPCNGPEYGEGYTEPSEPVNQKRAPDQEPVEGTEDGRVY